MNTTLTIFIEWLQTKSDLLFAVGGILVLAFFVMYMEFRQDAAKHKKQKQWLDGFDFPVAYFEEIQKQHPHLTSGEIKQAFEQLRSYLLACRHKSPQTGDLPTGLVDECWKVMILDTRNYHEFCNHVFGKYLHRDANGLASDVYTSRNERVAKKPQRELL
jgi:hypothetical protein